MRVILAPRPGGPDPSWAHTPAARRGAAGERAVRGVLAAALDDRYALVHNLYLPGGEGDVDAVLIGPRVLAIEIKTYADVRPLRVRALRWEYQATGGRWTILDDQPSMQAEGSARRVAYALRSAGLPAYSIVPVVALVGGAECLLERPRVPVLRPAELVRFAREGRSAVPPAWAGLALRALLIAGGVGAAR